MKALHKDFARELIKNKSRFLSVFLIVMLGSAFFSGIRSSRSDMLISADKYYNETALMDFRVIGTLGLTEEDLSDISKTEGVKAAYGGNTADVVLKNDDTKAVRMIAITDEVNKPTLTDGRMPETENECLADSLFMEVNGYKIGDTLTFETEGLDISRSEFVITGSANLPYFMDLNRGSGSVGNGKLSGFVLVKPEVFRYDYYTEIYVLMNKEDGTFCFGDEYEQLQSALEVRLEATGEACAERRYNDIQNEGKTALDEARNLLSEQKAKLAEAELLYSQSGIYSEEIEKKLAQVRNEISKAEAEISEKETELSGMEKPAVYILGRDTIMSYSGFESDAERIGNLGKLFPVVFFLVAALVSLTAMTRMVEEHRQQIGTMKALGSGDGAIMARYIGYAMIPTLTGAIIGVLIGEKLLPYAIVSTYCLLYEGLPYIEIPYNLVQGILAVAASVLCTGGGALFACYRASATSPAQLMRPAAPKSGKRILIERIGAVWKKFSFTQKSTLRNMFRYKKRFIMTVTGVAGCMGLVLVGLGLHDSIMVVCDKQFDEITHYRITATFPDGEDYSVKKETADSVEEKYPGTSVMLVYEKNLDVRHGDKITSVTVEVPEKTDGIDNFFTFRERKSREKVELPESGAIISEKTASTLGVSVGDTVEIDTGKAQAKSVKITGIFENYIGHYIFISPESYRELYGSDADFSQIFVNTGSHSEDEIGSFLMQNGNIKGVSFVSDLLDWANETLESLNIIVYIVLAAAALLAFVVLYNLNSINLAERQRELSTLKVLGFYDKEVAVYIYKENILLSVIGTFFGIFFGMILHSYVIRSIEVDLIMFGRSISPLSYLLGAVLTIMFALFVNLIMYRDVRKIDMLKSMKSIE